MKESLGRNDFCYCGSRRKYKDCHLKPFYPREYFTCEITEFDSIKFENRLPKQYFEVGRVDVSFRRPIPWDNEILDLLKPFTNVKWKENDRWENRIKKRIDKIHHKLDAIKYHIESFKNFEMNIESNSNKRIIANTTMNKIYDDPLLIYNFESFLFQSKSCLDVFSQLLAYSFKMESTTYSNFGDDLVKIFHKKLQKEGRPEVGTVIGIVQGARHWIRELVDMRDEVTHFSDLEGLSCFLIVQSRETDKYVRVYYPSIPSGERVSKYMDRTWNNVCRLISDSAKLSVDYRRM